MSDTYPPNVQRATLLTLADALVSAAAALRRDDNNDWRINGSAGHIYAVPGVPQRPRPGYLMFCERETRMAWTYAKKALPFCLVTQDGGTEGCFFLDRLPDEAEAEAIRDTLGVRKRPAYSPEEIEARALRMRGVRGQKPASATRLGGEEPNGP